MEITFEYDISSNKKMTQEGYLLCLNVPLTRTGTVEYGSHEIPSLTSKNGKITILRGDEIFNSEFLSSILNKPVVLEHPPHKQDVNANCWTEYAKGECTNVFVKDSIVYGDLLIKDMKTIELIQNGINQVSLGYRANYKPISEGYYQQFPTHCNHIAITRMGRLGSDYAVRDSKENIMENEPNATVTEKTNDSQITELEKTKNSLFDKFLVWLKDEKSTENTVPASTTDAVEEVTLSTLQQGHTAILECLNDIKSLMGTKTSDSKEGEEGEKDEKDEKTTDSLEVYGAINAFIPNYPKEKVDTNTCRSALQIAMTNDSISSVIGIKDAFAMSNEEVVSLLLSAFNIKKELNKVKQEGATDSKVPSPSVMTAEQMTALQRQKMGVD